jgi:hypothetical protein
MTKIDFVKQVFNPHIQPVLRAEGVFIDEHTATSWYGFMAGFHTATILKVMRSLDTKPIPRLIRDACRRLEEREQVKYQSDSIDYKGNRYRELKKLHRLDWEQFVNLTLTSQPLTERYESARDIVNPYIINSFGYFNLKDSLSETNSGFYHSYNGLFCECLADELTPLTGKKVGDIQFKRSKPVSYDEEHFARLAMEAGI